MIIVLEQARRKLGAILGRDSVIFGENFSDGRILSAILLESSSKSSHLGRRVTSYSQHKLKLKCRHIYYNVISLLPYFGHPPTTMDAILATIVAGRRAQI